MVKFTKDEQEFINHCFSSTLVYFVENPLERDNEEHIRQAINYRNYNIGHIGVENHKLMHSILDKLGYCKDGKTTKTEAMTREIELEKEKAEIWAKERDFTIEQIDGKIKELQKMKRDLVNHDKKFNEEVKEKAVVAQNEFKEKIKEERIESQNLLIKETQKALKDMTLRELRTIAMQNKIPKYSRMLKVDLITAIEESV